MGPSLVARSIQALEDLRGALNRFSQDATAALGANEGEIRKAEDYLAQRERYWQSEARSAEADLQRAASALSTCQAYAARAAQEGQGGVSCEREAAAVRAAQLRVEQAQRNLAESRRIALRLHDEIGAYQQGAQGLRSAVPTNVSRASNWLARQISSLREAAQTGPSGMGSIVGGTVGALGGLAAGALGAAIGGAFGTRSTQPLANVPSMPPTASTSTTPAAPPSSAPASVSANATVEALQAQVNELSARDLAAQQAFYTTQQAAASDASLESDIAQATATNRTDQESDARIPPGATPEASSATESDREREGPPGDPHWRI